MRTQEDGTNVFVIEDDASLSQAVGRLLKMAGFCVRTFASAEAALADASIGQADCFVLDIFSCPASRASSFTAG